jgi:hypothetical protein
MERVQIFNTEGRLINEMNTSGMNMVNVEDLPRGLYLVTLHTEKGAVTKKVIITN